jgi:RNA-binding protein YhbY
MKLKGLIGNIENTGSTKVAAQKAPQSSSVLSAIDEALAQAESVKVASDRTPAGDLEKIAAEVATSNRDGEVAHVEKLGAAMADSFVRQLAAYETASEKIAMEKSASMNLTAEELQMVHEVRTNPDAFIAKVAQLAGTQTEKTAAEVWESTAQETVRAIHKTAMDHYAAGYSTVVEALKA